MTDKQPAHVFTTCLKCNRVYAASVEKCPTCKVATVPVYSLESNG